MGRNIILLSDGAGNSAAALNKSNVWRIYQALDLSDDQQIAFYDEGVGTSGFKPLRMLGGAFGWGLSRNVRQMYEFLCRHYGDGDKIYIFGFSRGAFTARVLAHFIIRCGIIDRDKKAPGARILGYAFKEVPMNQDDGFRRGVKNAYKSYRRGYWEEATLFLRIVSEPFRRVRDRLFNEVLEPEKFRQKYSHKKNDGSKIDIEFVGVWDTVDAVGLPVDELTTLVNNRIYPYKFPDQNPSKHFKRACHAIAVDDERQTFHPLLWNERGIRDSDRITQVWFPGMHSNIGGSYPDDDLAHISLEWMIGQVKAKTANDGLKFNDDRVEAIAQRAQPLGKMYDSRRGASVYYRYKPRRIDDLCWDSDSHVYISEPKIHHSVLDRIAAGTVGYAPAGIPKDYRLVMRNGDITALNPPTYETPDQRDAREGMLERAQSHIFWRRVAYFSFLFLTLCLVFLPQVNPAIPGVEPRKTAVVPEWTSWFPNWFAEGLEALLVALEGTYTKVFEIVSPFLPAFTDRWLEAWAQSAGWFSLFLLGLIALRLWSRAIVRNTRRIAEGGWWHVKKLAPEQRYDGGPFVFERTATMLRNKGWTRFLHRFLIKKVVPAGFAVLCLYLAAGLAYRILWHYPFVADGICSKEGAQQADAPAEAMVIGTTGSAELLPIMFDAKTPCHNTGLRLNAGQRYTVKVDWNPRWEDLATRAGINGFADVTDNFSPIFLAALPMRRHISKPWFMLMGEIDRDSGNVYPFNRENFTFTPRHTGTLYLYVNDAINATDRLVPVNRAKTIESKSWKAYYRNNTGTAEITVTAGE